MSKNLRAAMCMVVLGSAVLLPEAGGPPILGTPRAEAHGTAQTPLQLQMPSVLPPLDRRGAPDGRCTRAERRRALAHEQHLVLARLGPLTTLRNEADQAKLAALGWGLTPHGYTSLGGMGFTLTQPDFLVEPVEPGNPHLLFFEPSRAAKVVTDPFGSDFPYHLRGWGYIPTYDYHQHPTGLPCMARRDWFVHERGVHTLDGGFEAKPPKEDVHGTAAGSDPPLPSPTRPGGPHPRFWDIHFWLRDRVPAVSILNPGRRIRGLDPHIGEWFFYPPPFKGDR